MTRGIPIVLDEVGEIEAEGESASGDDLGAGARIPTTFVVCDKTWTTETLAEAIETIPANDEDIQLCCLFATQRQFDLGDAGGILSAERRAGKMGDLEFSRGRRVQIRGDASAKTAGERRVESIEETGGHERTCFES